MQWNGGKAKITKHQCDSLCIGASVAKDDKRLALHLIENVHQIEIFKFGRYEKVVLLQILNSLIFAVNLNTDRIFQTGTLKFGYF